MTTLTHERQLARAAANWRANPHHSLTLAEFLRACARVSASPIKQLGWCVSHDTDRIEIDWRAKIEGAARLLVGLMERRGFCLPQITIRPTPESGLEAEGGPQVYKGEITLDAYFRGWRIVSRAGWCDTFAAENVSFGVWHTTYAHLWGSSYLGLAPVNTDQMTIRQERRRNDARDMAQRVWLEIVEEVNDAWGCICPSEIIGTEGRCTLEAPMCMCFYPYAREIFGENRFALLNYANQIAHCRKGKLSMDDKEECTPTTSERAQTKSKTKPKITPLEMRLDAAAQAVGVMWTPTEIVDAHWQSEVWERAIGPFSSHGESRREFKPESIRVQIQDLDGNAWLLGYATITIQNLPMIGDNNQTHPTATAFCGHFQGKPQP